MYDYLIVGAGLFGSVFANKAQKAGKKCLVIDKRSHIGGNCFTKNLDGIEVHEYGAHIFRTSNKYIWNWLSTFVEFNNFVNTPIAVSHGVCYNLPFNMNTFSKIWGVIKPQDAERIISEQSQEIQGTPRNLEEKAISLVGRDIYETFIKGYTKKQWGKDCDKLPASIIRRLPFRLTYNNNYFNSRYQGIPVNGYTDLFTKLLVDADIQLNTNFMDNPSFWTNQAKKVLFTGPIDEYFNYCFGELEYRGLEFKTERYSSNNYQGVAVVNYVDECIPYTRSIEHKHFNNTDCDFTLVTYEYPRDWRKGDEPYYPINDEKNNQLYRTYYELARNSKNIIFGGRLGSYQYLDMEDTILQSLELVSKEISFEAAINY